MRIDHVYEAVINDLRKARGGYYPPSQFNIDAPRAQRDAFNAGLVAFHQSGVLPEALYPFKAKFTYTPATSPSGKVTVPTDYCEYLNVNPVQFSNTLGKQLQEVRFVEDAELSNALKSQVRPVSLSAPIAVEGSNFIQLYPEVTQTGVLNYLRFPTDPVYGYTTVGRQPVYDSASSVDIEFTDVYINDIIDRIVAYANRFLDEQTKAQ